MAKSKVKGQAHRGQKTKVSHFVHESSSEARSLCGIFSGTVLAGAAMPVGKSAHAV